jgi:hypothetical protein
MEQVIRPTVAQRQNQSWPSIQMPMDVWFAGDVFEPT